MKLVTRNANFRYFVNGMFSRSVDAKRISWRVASRQIGWWAVQGAAQSVNTSRDTEEPLILHICIKVALTFVLLTAAVCFVIMSPDQRNKNNNNNRTVNKNVMSGHHHHHHLLTFPDLFSIKLRRPFAPSSTLLFLREASGLVTEEAGARHTT